MSTFKIYTKSANLNKNDLKCSSKPGENVKVLQELPVNGQIALNVREKESNISNGKYEWNPKSANDIENQKEYFRFNTDEERQKSKSKTKSVVPITTTSKQKLQKIKILAKKESKSRHQSIDRRNDSITPQLESMLNQGCIFNNISSLHKSDHNITCHSPIPVNNLTAPYTLLTKRVDRMRHPKLLPRRIHGDRRTTYVGDIFMEEYLEDIMHQIALEETQIILSDGFLEKFNHNKETRGYIVNWMISVQRQMNMSESEYYLAVNLMDQILGRIAVPMNMYQLLAISSIWIINKFIGSKIYSGSDMIDLSNNAYIIQQLLRMEKKVLKIMNFQLHFVEPSICINIYMRYLEIDEQKIAQHKIYYVLDCSTLIPGYSSIRTTISSAAALNVAVKIFYKDMVEVVEQYFNSTMSREYVEIRKATESQIYSIILDITNEEYRFREAHFKYKANQQCMKFPSITFNEYRLSSNVANFF